MSKRNPAAGEDSQKKAVAARRLARLAAVQALYQGSYGEQTIAEILREAPDMVETEVDGDPDRDLFNDIVHGVTKDVAVIDGMVNGALGPKISSERMEILLRSILRAGAYELHNNNSAPAGAIISDYVDVAHAFFNGREPGMVNGILDAMAKKLRQ